MFVGETKLGKEIMGLHNWVHFYLQEKQGNVDYKGYKARDNKDTVIKHCIILLCSSKMGPSKSPQDLVFKYLIHLCFNYIFILIIFNSYYCYCTANKYTHFVVVFIA